MLRAYCNGVADGMWYIANDEQKVAEQDAERSEKRRIELAKKADDEERARELARLENSIEDSPQVTTELEGSAKDSDGAVPEQTEVAGDAAAGPMDLMDMDIHGSDEHVQDLGMTYDIAGDVSDSTGTGEEVTADPVLSTMDNDAESSEQIHDRGTTHTTPAEELHLASGAEALETSSKDVDVERGGSRDDSVPANHDSTGTVISPMNAPSSASPAASCPPRAKYKVTIEDASDDDEPKRAMPSSNVEMPGPHVPFSWETTGIFTRPERERVPEKDSEGEAQAPSKVPVDLDAEKKTKNPFDIDYVSDSDDGGGFDPFLTGAGFDDSDSEADFGSSTQPKELADNRSEAVASFVDRVINAEGPITQSDLRLAQSIPKPGKLAERSKDQHRNVQSPAVVVVVIVKATTVVSEPVSEPASEPSALPVPAAASVSEAVNALGETDESMAVAAYDTLLDVPSAGENISKKHFVLWRSPPLRVDTCRYVVVRGFSITERPHLVTGGAP